MELSCGCDADFIALLEELTGASLCSRGSIGASGQVQGLSTTKRHSLSECTGVSITEMFDGWPPLFKLGRSLKRGKKINGQSFHLVREIPSLGVDDENVWRVNPHLKKMIVN